MAKKPMPESEGKRKKKNTNQKKMKTINKQTTKQKHNTPTEDIIPTHKQQHMIIKLTHQNTRYIQIGQTIQEQATSPPPEKKTLAK